VKLLLEQEERRKENRKRRIAENKIDNEKTDYEILEEQIDFIGHDSHYVAHPRLEKPKKKKNWVLKSELWREIAEEANRNAFGTLGAIEMFPNEFINAS
jgi:hypothetical protein